MRKTHRIILFTVIVGVLTELILLLMHDQVDHYFWSFLVDLLCVLCGFKVLLAILSTSTTFIGIILQSILLLVLSPWSLRFLPGIFGSISITYEHYVLYAPISFIGIALVFGSIFSHREKQLEKTAAETQDNFCKQCGQNISSTEAFCPHCHKLSHKVYETLERYPRKHYLDFTPDIREGSAFCPHCGDHKGIASAPFCYLKTPIQACKNCRQFYLEPCCYEWAVVSPAKRIHLYCSSVSFQLCVLCIVFYLVGALIYQQNIPFTLTLLCSAFLLRFIWIKVVCAEDLQASEQRLEQNPDYLQTLADMGYYSQMDKTLRAKIQDHGTKSDFVICEYCGSRNPADEKLCTRCNAPLPLAVETAGHSKWDESDWGQWLSKPFLVKIVAVCLVILFALLFWRA